MPLPPLPLLGSVTTCISRPLAPPRPCAGAAPPSGACAARCVVPERSERRMPAAPDTAASRGRGSSAGSGVGCGDCAVGEGGRAQVELPKPLATARPALGVLGWLTPSM
eukprot:366449-Chlamydomonas_euryale.AAC.16